MIAIGEVDEANSAIGVAIAALDASSQALASDLRRIQNEMFDLGADLATPDGIDGALRITNGQVARIEQGIDAMNDDLSPLTSFILPGGSVAVASLHLARAIARRAERAAVSLNEAEPVNPQAIAYLNRLSDHLFVSARYVATRSGTGDVLWQPGATRS
jgi:cob(I)alamin adenosyltransferase